jgi:hypothetical protein
VDRSEKAIPGGQIINEILTYDAADTVSPDNGYSVFVTANGRRWKDLSKGYNPLFLLGAVGYESISSCINKIAYDLAVLWGNKKGVIDYCTTIRIPGMPRGETRYHVTEPFTFLHSFPSIWMWTLALIITAYRTLTVLSSTTAISRCYWIQTMTRHRLLARALYFSGRLSVKPSRGQAHAYSPNRSGQNVKCWHHNR